MNIEHIKQPAASVNIVSTFELTANKNTNQAQIKFVPDIMLQKIVFTINVRNNSHFAFLYDGSLYVQQYVYDKESWLVFLLLASVVR